MTNPARPTASTVKRVRIVSLIVLGALIPLLLATVLQLVTFHASTGESPARAFAVNGTMLVGEALTMIVAFRIARYSKLPGTPTILLLMGVMILTVLASHFL